MYLSVVNNRKLPMAIKVTPSHVKVGYFSESERIISSKIKDEVTVFVFY